jgi:uncharacterized phage protein (TIGR02218 family)
MATDTFCTLWEVTAKSGMAVRVTNFESDLVFDGETYTAVPLEPTDMQRASGLSPDNADITIPLVEPFTSTKLLGGFWRGARVVIRTVDYMDLGAAAAETRIGYIGEVPHNEHVLTPQYRSLAQVLNQPVGDLYSDTCRVKRFGDELCKADLTPYTYAFSVSAVTSDQQFTITGTFADDLLHMGWVEWATGNNAGLEEEILDNTGGAVTLFRPMVGTVQVGDTGNVVEGCNRTATRCKQIVNLDNPSGTNIENMRAEPFTPGRSVTFTYPS